MSIGFIDTVRAAASSIANGIPSTRWQISPTAAHWRSSQVQLGRPCRGHDRGTDARRRCRRDPDPSAESVGVGERSHAHHVLARHVERFPARGQHRDRRAALHDRVGERARVVEHVLAVVEHQEQLAHLQVLDDARRQRQAGMLHAAQRGRDDLRHRVGVVGGRELAHPCTRGEARQHLCCDLHREPGLADAAGTSQRDQPCVVQQRGDACDVGVAADERGHLHREVPRERGQRRAAAGTPDSRSGWRTWKIRSRRPRSRSACSPRSRSSM